MGRERLGNVLVSSLVYVVVTAAVLTAVLPQAVGMDRGSGASGEFTNGLVSAWGDGAPIGVCGYPVPDKGQTVEIAHEEIVVIARCLKTRGNLTSGAVARIEGDPSFSITLTTNENGFPSVSAFSTGSGEVERPRWVLGVRILWVVGLGVVVWYFGFRWRRRAA